MLRHLARARRQLGKKRGVRGNLPDDRITPEIEAEKPRARAAVTHVRFCWGHVARVAHDAGGGLRDRPGQCDIAEDSRVGRHQVAAAQRQHLKCDERGGDAPDDQDERHDAPETRRKRSCRGGGHAGILALYTRAVQGTVTDVQHGQLVHVFGVSILDAALLSWVALLWYRRSVRRLMREGGAAAVSLPGGLPQSVPTPRTRPGDQPEELSLREEHFFFQAEDGIRDVAVTGVQTCALPI